MKISLRRHLLQRLLDPIEKRRRGAFRLLVLTHLVIPPHDGILSPLRSRRVEAEQIAGTIIAERDEVRRKPRPGFGALLQVRLDDVLRVPPLWCTHSVVVERPGLEPREHHGEQSADHEEQQTFDEHLPYEAPPRRAEGGRSR